MSPLWDLVLMPVVSRHAQPVIASTHRRPGEDVASWAARGPEVVGQSGATVFRIGALRLSEQASRDLALDLVRAAHEQLVADGLPADSALQHDRIQASTVADGAWSRTLMPHHDGGHAPYLTPSVKHDPNWQPARRTFAPVRSPRQRRTRSSWASSSRSRATYSATTYFPLMKLLAHAYRHQHGTAAPDAATPARWLGENLRGAIARSADHSCPSGPRTSLVKGDADTVKSIWPELVAVLANKAQRDIKTNIHKNYWGRLEQIGVRARQPRLVPWMSVHQAKGREWSAVGVRLADHDRSLLTSGLTVTTEVERQLYVTLTRARRLTAAV